MSGGVHQQTVELGRLAAMAARVGGDGLDDVYLALANLFEDEEDAFSARERKLALDILRRLTKEVEMEVRIGLAMRIADKSKYPHEIILLLVDDRIEVARPLLAASPLLSDSDLIHVIQTGTTDHQIAVAERPYIGEPVSLTLARLESEPVIAALLGNRTAKIGAAAWTRIEERARAAPDWHPLLVDRSDLPPAFVGQMYEWVSDSLKTTLAHHYPDAALALGRSLDQTTAALRTGTPYGSERTAAILIKKMVVGDQLRPSFLVRVVQQGQMDLFEHGLATLLGMEVGLVRRAIYGGPPLLAALAYRAIGVDRAVFPTVYKLSRQYRGAITGISTAEQSKITKVFESLSRAEALEKFKIAAGA